ncbi:MAG: hypothetical protein VB039_01905 [Oscillospiraceae bacterium]|nr:hypothetical protein [Oscillospiraceae bacterium]
MNKFENVDVLSALNGIMRTNTVYFQNDFDIDKKILLKAAEIPEKGPMLWFSRPSGTCCVSEHDVFLKGTHAHNTWKFYGEQTSDKLLAYAVELSGMKSGRLMGNLYELDYSTHWQHVRDTALQPETVAVTYEDGHTRKFPVEELRAVTNGYYGSATAIQYEPHNQIGFQILLNQERLNRRDLPPADISQHIASLRDKMAVAEDAPSQRPVKPKKHEKER